MTAMPESEYLQKKKRQAQKKRFVHLLSNKLSALYNWMLRIILWDFKIRKSMTHARNKKLQGCIPKSSQISKNIYTYPNMLGI